MQNTHTESENHPWMINISDHPKRSNSPEYNVARKLMIQIVSSIKAFFLGEPPYQDHHGGGLWLKDSDGWFLVKNIAGIEWSAQFCADPAKVDMLRINAKRLYAQFPFAAQELGITALLEQAIVTADDVARWTDSICNASIPLPQPLHTGVIPKGGGVHHYPTPIADIPLFKRDDFVLWVSDEDGKPAAVVPVAPRGSGDGRVAVTYAYPGSKLHTRLKRSQRQDKHLVLPADSPLAKQAYKHQQEVANDPQEETRQEGFGQEDSAQEEGSGEEASE